MTKISSPPDNNSRNVSPPRRFIFNDVDLQHFIESPAKKELLRVTEAMGRSCASKLSYTYDPNSPLTGLSPAMAALQGSLRAMLLWLSDFPPIDRSKVRFGNPSFRKWHVRLVERSVSIVYNILQTHQEYPEVIDYDMTVLQASSERGYQAAGSTSICKDLDSIPDECNQAVVAELCAYFCAAFGHEIRIDYGTGHECSFQVFLYSLCKLGCFGSTSDSPPSAERLKAVTISIYSSYLPVTRQLQTEYMLEPAGSHGVWGLDDYHCLPFYFGACQLQADADEDVAEPSIIHNDSVLQREGDRYLYFGSIRYIKLLKKGVPFFESSPMLNDITQLATWQKVSSGLLRLFEGEVLNKRQVVQHFVFGNIFAANWTSSQEEEKKAPSTTFRTSGAVPPLQAAVGPMTRAPWNEDPGSPPSSPVSPSSRRRAQVPETAAAGLTRAPWADNPDDSSSMPPPATRAPWAK